MLLVVLKVDIGQRAASEQSVLIPEVQPVTILPVGTNFCAQGHEDRLNLPNSFEGSWEAFDFR